MTLPVAEPRGDGGAKSKGCRRIIERYSDPTCPRDGIRQRRDFADFALNYGVGKKRQADRKWQTRSQLDGKIRAEIDDGLPDIGPRNRQHALARRDHLSDLGPHGRHHTGEIRLQLRIAQLFDCLCQVCLTSRGYGFSARPTLFGAVQHGFCGRVACNQNPLPLFGGACIGKPRLGL